MESPQSLNLRRAMAPLPPISAAYGYTGLPPVNFSLLQPTPLSEVVVWFLVHRPPPSNYTEQKQLQIAHDCVVMSPVCHFTRAGLASQLYGKGFRFIIIVSLTVPDPAHKPHISQFLALFYSEFFCISIAIAISMLKFPCIIHCQNNLIQEFSK